MLARGTWAICAAGRLQGQVTQAAPVVAVPTAPSFRTAPQLPLLQSLTARLHLLTPGQPARSRCVTVHSEDASVLLANLLLGKHASPSARTHFTQQFVLALKQL